MPPRAPPSPPSSPPPRHQSPIAEEAGLSFLFLIGVAGVAGLVYYQKTRGAQEHLDARRVGGKALLRHQESTKSWDGEAPSSAAELGGVEMKAAPTANPPPSRSSIEHATDGDDDKPPCAVCGRPARKVCAGCRAQRYCSIDCQTAHWPTHSLVCYPAADDSSDGGGGGGPRGSADHGESGGGGALASGLSRWYRDQTEKRDARRAEREAKRAEASQAREAQRADENERRAAATAQKRAADALERAFEQAAAADHPGDAEMQAIEDAIEKADEAGVDELTLSAAERRLKEVESRAEAALRSAAKGRMAEELAAIEATVSKGGDLADRGALALLQLVYDKHPPKKASVSLASLQALDASQHGPIKKALLQAQRDYHPDRNTGTVRETLDRNPAEWEVLCLTICQQLALVYDALFKGDRVMHD